MFDEYSTNEDAESVLIDSETILNEELSAEDLRECDLIFQELVERGGSIQRVEQILGKIIRKAINATLDGRKSLDECSPPRKSQFGVNFEERFLKAFRLPSKLSKANNPHKLLLDTRMANLTVDVKTCLGGKNFMIPKECFGYWCLTLSVDWRNDIFELGLFKAYECDLRPGVNTDEKHSPKAEAFKKCQWLMYGFIPPTKNSDNYID